MAAGKDRLAVSGRFTPLQIGRFIGPPPRLVRQGGWRWRGLRTGALTAARARLQRLASGLDLTRPRILVRLVVMVHSSLLRNPQKVAGSNPVSRTIPHQFKRLRITSPLSGSGGKVRNSKGFDSIKGRELGRSFRRWSFSNANSSNSRHAKLPARQADPFP